MRDPGALSGCETWQVFEKCFFFPLLASVGMRLIALLLLLLLLSLCLAKPIESIFSLARVCSLQRIARPLFDALWQPLCFSAPSQDRIPGDWLAPITRIGRS